MCGQPEGLAMQVPRAFDAHLAAGLPALASPALARDGRNPGIDVEAGLHVAIEQARSEEHTSELQSLMRISYAVFCLKKKNKPTHKDHITTTHNKIYKST